jgi:predicted phage gp36 major capsid-like protein
MSRTVENIQKEQDAILASADERPEDERSLNSEEVERYEALEQERQAVVKSEHVRSLHAAARTFSGAPAVIGAQARGDRAAEVAFDNYLRTGIPNSDLTFAQTEGTPAAGGYAVPDTFLNRLTERRVAFGGLMNEAENITTADGRPIAWPSVVPPVYTEADIAAEGAASAAGADLVFGEVTLGAYKYTSTGTGNVPVKVSVELAQDALFDVGALVTRFLGERIARKQAYDLCNGSGYRAGAKWIMNDTTAKGIEQLLDGASGTSGRPLLVNAIQGIEGPSNNYQLLGYPVVIDQAMPTWAADDVIGAAFGNWKEAYIVRHVKEVQVLVNPYAAVGYVVYDAWARMDGKVQNAYAYVTGEGV